MEKIINSFFEKNVSKLEEIFKKSLTNEERYHLIIDLGKTLPPMPPELKTKANIVPGCQSILHLHATSTNNRIFFLADAEALISKGLAAILIQAYQGLSPEEILTCPPTFLTHLQITPSLSLTRSNGLAQIHLKMKQKALQFLSK